MSRLCFLLSVSILAAGCSTSSGSRRPSSANEEQFDAKNIYSLQRSFWSEQRDGKEHLGLLSAFVVKEDLSQEGLARLLVYAEDPKTNTMVKLVDNNRFIWSGIMAGTEPNLEVNRKNSLVIVSGNEGSGRIAWVEKVTARYLPGAGKLEVVAYDYETYDKLQLDEGYSCSYNFLTGKAKAATIRRIGVFKRKVKPVRGPVDLNAWTEAHRPKDCIPQ